MPSRPPIRAPFLTDSYKVSQHKQYPPDAEVVYSYFEARGGAMFPSTSFVGLQAMLKGYMTGACFSLEDVAWARKKFAQHFGRDDIFNYAGWVRLYEKHQGRLPLLIKAVPEGMSVPNQNVLMTVENTDPEFPWLTSYFETFLVHVWYPCTVATLSREVKKIILRYLHETGDPSLIDFKLHDFGYRGSTSVESAGIGGMAHLTNFMGTDTLRGIEFADWFYNERMAGFSIPASEHSTMTSWGGPEHEFDAFKNMLDKFPEGLVACVSDSYDVFRAIRDYWGTDLKVQIMERDGTLVIRPDSGEPTAVVLECCRIIWEKFGGSVNEKGYKVFDPHVRLIQGDGIGWYRQQPASGERLPYHTINDILGAMKYENFSTDNIGFGSGGGLLQVMDRDTQRLAFKCSAIRRNGVWHDAWKDPATSHGKASKRGRLKLVSGEKYPRSLRSPSEENSQVLTRNLDDNRGADLLQTVFLDGEIKNPQTFSQIRARANVGVILPASI